MASAIVLEPSRIFKLDDVDLAQDWAPLVYLDVGHLFFPKCSGSHNYSAVLA